MNGDLEQAIGYFEASIVQKFDIDLLNKRIFINIKANHNGKFENHEIMFHGISAFYFSNGPDNARFNTRPWNYIELSDIGFHRDPKDHITCIHDNPKSLQYNSDPNFNLDIWGKLFLIEAQEVTIDGVIYQAR